MAAEDESIGGIRVDIVGDYSKLQGDIDAAASIASAGGAEIASALNAGAQGADALSGAITAAATGMGSFEAQIQALVDTGSTLAEALAAVDIGVASVAADVGQAGAAAAAAATQMSLFDEAVQVPYADAAGQLNLFATQLEPIGPAAQQAAVGATAFGAAAERAGEAAAAGAEGERQFSEGAQAVIDRQKQAEAATSAAAAALRELFSAYQQGQIDAATLARAQQELADTIEKTGQASSQATSGVQELVTQLLAIGGITLSIEALKAFTEETINLYAASERAGEGIAFLRGNIAASDAIMQDLRNTAQNLAVPFDSVIAAAQKMAFFKLTAEQTKEAIEAASDAAKASGGSFDSMANAISNIALTGMAMPRTLKNIGIEASDLADVLGVSVGQMQKVFKEMDEGSRFDALILSMERTKGATKAMADDTTSDLTRMKNSFEFAMTDMGSAVAPLALQAIPTLVDAFKGLVSGGAVVLTGLKFIGDSIAGLASIAFEAAVGLGKVWFDTITGNFKAAASVASDALANIRSAGQFTWQSLIKDAQDGNAVIEKVWAQQTDAAKASAKSQMEADAESVKSAAAAAAARLAGSKELKKELAEVATFAKGIAPALAEADLSYQDYLVTLMEGGKKASAVLTQLTQDIAKGEAEAAKMSGAPKAAMEEWLAKLREAQKTMEDFAAQDAEGKAWSDILDKRAAYAAKVAEEAQKINDQMVADQQKADLMVEQGELTHQEKLLETQRATAAEQTKIHSITAFDQMAIDLDLDAKENALAEGALQRELRILDESVVAQTDYASKREAILLKIQALQDKIDGKAQVAAIQAQTEAWKVLGLTSDTALTTQIKEADAALAILVKQNAAQGDLYAGEEKTLALRIQLAERSGADATAQIVHLQNIKLQQQLLYDQTHLLGDLYVGVVNDILKGWESLGKSVADNIIDEKNWHDVWINGIKSIAKSITETLVGGAFKALEDSVLKSTGLMDGLTKAFDKLLGTATKAVAGDVAGSAAKSAGGATTNISNTFSGGGALSSAGAIGAIASAIEGAFGLAQMSHLISTSGQIEQNTRRMDIVFEKFAQTDEWDRQTNLFAKLDDMWSAIRDVSSAVANGAQGIVDTLASLASGASASPASLPRVPDLPSVGVPSSATYASSSTTNSNASIGSVTFIVNGAQDPRQTVRSVADSLKILSPKFSVFGT